MTYKTIDDVLADIIGSVLNDKAESFVNRDGEPAGSEFIHEDDFDDVVGQVIKDIKESKYINIKFREGMKTNIIIRYDLSRDKWVVKGSGNVEISLVAFLGDLNVKEIKLILFKGEE